VTNQRSRWGSCTPDDGTIRLSTQLRGMPGWVVDYVLMHELTHLLVPGHGQPFWDLVNRYPRTERARGYLEGVAATAGLPLTDGDQPRERPAGAGDLPRRGVAPLLDGDPPREEDPLMAGDPPRDEDPLLGGDSAR
jgi:hypothetical protein